MSLTAHREPTPAEFARVFRAFAGPITLVEAAMSIDAIERGDEASMGERIAYRHAATAACTFCLDLPVQNAATWTNPASPPYIACPRCGETATIPESA